MVAMLDSLHVQYIRKEVSKFVLIENDELVGNTCSKQLLALCKIQGGRHWQPFFHLAYKISEMA